MIDSQHKLPLASPHHPQTLTFCNRSLISRFAIAVGLMLALLNTTKARASLTWTTVDIPNSSNSYLTDIDNGALVGVRVQAFGPDTDGATFSWDGVNWSLGMSVPFSGVIVTHAFGIDGDQIVGRIINTLSNIPSGYFFSPSTGPLFQNPPIGGWSYHTGIDAGHIVGVRGSIPGSWEGYLYDGTNWSFFNHPSTTPGIGWTSFWGIQGNLIVGEFSVLNGHDPNAGPTAGFVYDRLADTWTTLSFPGSVSTQALGVDNGYIVGDYADTHGTIHGFLYDLHTDTWTGLDFPGASQTAAWGIDGTTIVGWYEDTAGNSHGFMLDATSLIIPEPHALTVLLVGLSAGLVRRRR